jgi:hypothetical protein
MSLMSILIPLGNMRRWRRRMMNIMRKKSSNKNDL